MAQTVFIEAINQAIAEEMRRDESVFIMGEDIRLAVYGATANLLGEFGEKRVLDTPLSENGFFGAAVGASLVGMRPVVETLTSFMWVGMDQLISQAAKMRYMFGGQVKLPIVYRTGMWYERHIAAHHSDRPYSMFMNVPGLKVVVPSNPADAKGLLQTAIRDDDPVMFFEDWTILGSRGPVPEGDCAVPLGVGQVVRPGTDVTVVAIGGMVVKSLAVAEALATEGISVEVVDPRSLVPLDKQTILDSVARTGRLVVVDAAHRTCSAASEIAALVAQEGFWSLQSPVQRVASHNVHIPFSPVLEDLVYPNEEKITAAVRATLE